MTAGAPPARARLGPALGRAGRHAVLVLVLAVGVFPSCAIAVDDEAHEVANAPTDLFNTTTTPTVPEKAQYTIDLFFINEANKLVQVTRPRDAPATPQEALEALANPGADVAAENLTSKLGATVYTANPTIDNGLLTISVDDELRNTANADPDKVRQTYAQIVCTVAALDIGVATVTIVDDTGPIPVGVADATAPVQRAVSTADFGNCATDPTPPPLTIPTTTTRATTTTRRLEQPVTTASTEAQEDAGGTPPTTTP